MRSLASLKFRRLAQGVGLTIVWLISYPIVFFLVLPKAGLQLLPTLISNIGVTWNQFWYDGYIFGTLVVFLWLCFFRVKQVGTR